MQLSTRYKELATDHNCLCRSGLNRGICWRSEQPHDEGLRLIFTWCAAKLLDEELQKKICEAFWDMQCYMIDETDDKQIFRALDTLVFCHMWAAYVKARTIRSRDICYRITCTCELGLSLVEALQVNC